MKRQIKNKEGKVVREWEQRDPSILQGQLRFPHLVQKNKKRYNRKIKHKKNYREE